MKIPLAAIMSASLAMLVASCDSKKTETKGTPGEPAKIRILPVSPGDRWVYDVSLEIPSGITSAGAGAVSTKHRRPRTYLGKKSAAEGLPEVDCFEVTVPGSPDEREFVEIQNDRILLYGSLIMRPETTKPMWMDKPVLFFQTGMIPGTKIPEVSTDNRAFTRQTEDIAVEDVKVPAGTFHCHRLLMNGNDGEIELRRTIWFSPGNGIIREEKTRYRREKLLYREIQELSELKRAAASQ